MAPGEFRVPFRRDRDLEALLATYPHLRFEWGAYDIFCGPIFELDPQEALIVAKGASLAWWLGVDNEGTPDVIAFQRYCGRTNKLGNGDFELGELYWRRGAENSKWVIDTTSPIAGTHSARVGVDFQDDDVLQSDESFEVFPGDEMRLALTAVHTGAALGNLRMRHIFSGRFDHPNLNEDPGFDDSSKWELGDAPDIDIVNDPGEAYEGDNVLRVGPISKEQFLLNRGFDDSGGSTTHWATFNNVSLNTDRVQKGTHSMKFNEGGADTPAIRQALQPGFAEGNEFELSFWLSNAQGGGDDPQILFQMQYQDEDDEFQIDEVMSRLPFSGNGWKRMMRRWTLPEFTPTAGFPRVNIVTDEIVPADSAWWVDQVSALRIKGNVQAIGFADRDGATDNLAIVPKRRYRVTAKIRSSAGVDSGEVWFRAELRRSAFGTDLVDAPESQRVGVTKNKWSKFEWEFEAPSGYDRLNLHIYGQDIYGGSFWIDKVEIRDADETELIVDVDVPPASAATATEFLLDTTVPEGAESERVAILVEDDGEGWKVDNVYLIWLDTPEQASAIVSALIAGTGLTPGTIHTAGTILFDWVIRNKTPRQALDELSTGGLVQPSREWLVNPSGAVDWGMDSQVFTDRAGFVLTEEDVFIRSRPDLARSIERFATTVKVIGAERERFSRKRKFVVTGSAENTNPGYTLFNGDPYSRTMLVEDGSVDHPRQADGLAERIASENAIEARQYSLGVNDWLLLGTFRVGDWIYLYYPSEGAESPDYPREWQGQTVWPDKLRVLSRTWTLGAGPFRVFARRGPGDEVDITDYVEWPMETTADIQVGDRRQSFSSNPQGGAISRQWFRYRTAVSEP